jgi:pimeloyl-ACP methyl ester carboxylesterase
MDPQLQHVSIHGHEVGFRMQGDGPAVLLIHGIAGSSATWRDIMPALSEHYTVIAPDLIGHGQSAKPPGDYSLGAQASGLRDLLAVLGVERATVIGHSFGGGVALQMAYQYPHCCDRLVLVDSGGLGREVTWLLRLATLPGSEYVMPVLFPSFIRDAGNSVSRFLGGLGFRNPHVAEMWSAYSSLTEAASRQTFLRTVRSVMDPGGQSVSAMDRLYLGAHLPTLIVWGEDDAIIPVSHAHAAHEAIPGSRLEIIEGAGHFPHVEEPSRFAEAVVEFMRTTEPADASADSLSQLLREGGARSTRT